MGNHIWPLIVLVLIYLAPAAAASSGCFSLLAATVASIATDNTSNNVSTVITANNIASWTSLSSSIAAAAGKVVTLTLSTPFDMTGFQSGSCIDIDTAQTSITIVGNGAVFDAAGKDGFFDMGCSAPTTCGAVVMSNVTLQNSGGGAIGVEGTITLSDCSFSGNTAPGYSGGAINVYPEGTITLSDCSFSGNTAPDGGGGAIFVHGGGTITLSDCSFSGNTAPGPRGGGALYFYPNASGLLKNCSLLGTVSPNNNDIGRIDTTANVTFACADGEVGTPVQMSGTEITKIPAPTCTTLYYCPSGSHACVPCDYTGCAGVKDQTQCNLVFPNGCPP
jgi:predicted outer membrane repeat protein